ARNEIAAGLEHTVHGAYGLGFVFEKVQDRHRHHHVETVALEGDVLDGPLLETDISYSGGFGLALGDFDHPAREIDGAYMLDMGCVKEGGRAGTAAELEHIHVAAHAPTRLGQFDLIARLVGDRR